MAILERAIEERFQDLYAADAVSLQDLEVSRREYEVSEARLAITEKGVEDTELHALFSGVVAQTLVEEFENVRAKAENLVGGEAGLGRGFHLQMGGFAAGRLQTGGRATGVGQASLPTAAREISCRICRQRPALASA